MALLLGSHILPGSNIIFIQQLENENSSHSLGVRSVIKVQCALWVRDISPRLETWRTHDLVAFSYYTKIGEDLKILFL